jgi:hypothetical protein
MIVQLGGVHSARSPATAMPRETEQRDHRNCGLRNLMQDFVRYAVAAHEEAIPDFSQDLILRSYVFPGHGTGPYAFSNPLVERSGGIVVHVHFAYDKGLVISD